MHETSQDDPDGIACKSLARAHVALPHPLEAVHNARNGEPLARDVEGLEVEACDEKQGEGQDGIG